MRPGVVKKQFEIDFEKIKSLEDMIVILKGLDLSVTWYQKDCPEQYKEIFEAGFLKQTN